MKRTLKLFTFIMLLNMTSFAQIPNTGFENLDSTNALLNWINIDAISITLGDSILTDGFLISTSTDAHSGMYALELRNTYDYTTNTPLMNGAVTSTIPDTSLYQGFNPLCPISVYPYAVDFYYKFSQNPFNDSTLCSVKIFNSDSFEIGNGLAKFWDVNSVYQLKSVPINYLTSIPTGSGDLIPAFAQINFRNKVTSVVPHVGERVLIDDVSLNVSPSAISSIEKNSDFIIYPNPFTNYIHIKTKTPHEYVTLLSIFGVKLYEGTDIEKQDFSSIPNGVYILKTKTQFLKLIKD